MKIAKADRSHVQKLAQMNKYLIEDEGHPNPMNVQELAERMAGWLQGAYTCYVCTQDRETVAYCLFRDDGEYYYMRHLFVERAHRRKGIATALLDWMYQNVWTDKKVQLEVLAHNEEAIAFYEAYGFRISCLTMDR